MGSVTSMMTLRRMSSACCAARKYAAVRDLCMHARHPNRPSQPSAPQRRKDPPMNSGISRTNVYEIRLQWQRRTNVAAPHTKNEDYESHRRSLPTAVHTSMTAPCLYPNEPDGDTKLEPCPWGRWAQSAAGIAPPQLGAAADFMPRQHL